MSDLASVAQRRALSLVDFLEALYRRRYPPVRDIAKYDDFLKRDRDLPEVPGVVLTPGGSRWLTLRLVSHPQPPSLPEELVPVVEENVISAHYPPTIRADVEDVEVRTQAQEVLDAWITEAWQPWSERWREIENGRAFYKTAFDLRTRVQRDRESYELVWGFGRLRWNHQPEEIDHPLLTVPIEVDHDRSDGSLSFIPAGAVSVEYAFLADLPIADRGSYLDRRRSAEDIELDPWNTETIQSEYAGLLRSIDLDGQSSWMPGEVNDRHAIVDDSWVLYLRRRQADYLGFLEAQRQVLLEDPESVPLPIASLVVDEPSRLTNEGSAWGDGEDVELLLPLPSNEEQHAILTKAARRAGVTAQGPPGTGKTHTIANLISHFVAYGQRVLVVAEKEQAIKVVADKVPEGIRALVVSNLGSDAESRTHLEQSITSIQAGVFNVTTVPTIAELERRQTQMDDIASRIARLSAELRDRTMSESMPCPASIAAPGRTTPPEVAAWLSDQATRLSYIPDRLSVDQPCPISPAELGELISILRTVDSRDLEEALLLLPPQDLPASSKLAEVDNALRQLMAQLATTAITDWSAVDAADPEALDQLSRQLDEVLTRFTKWSGSWIARVRDELPDAGYYQGWLAFTATIRRERDFALELAKTLVTHDVVVPEGIGDPAGFRHSLELARDQFSAGRKLGFGTKNLRNAVEQCLVDGAKPASEAAVQLCMMEFDLRESRRRLAVAWRRQTGRLNAPPLETTTPEHEIGDWVSELEWLFAWKSNWPRLSESLSQLGIDVLQVPDLEEIDRLKKISGLFPVRRQERALRQLHGGWEQYLSQQAQVPGAAPLWADLHDALRTHDWDRWAACLQRCEWLMSIQPKAQRAIAIQPRLAQSAPLWAANISSTRGEAAGDPALLEDAWRWRCSETWIGDLNNRKSAAELQRSVEDANRQRLRAVEDLVVGRAWHSLADKFTDHHRIALMQYVNASKQLGKGHSKYAARFQRNLRNALNDARDAVPVWIMTIGKALESFRAESDPPFDVLIVDEASQVGLEATPVLGLARRAIVVGDDKQTSPEDVGQNLQPIFDLMDEHLSEIPNYRVLFAPKNSLYDMAAMQFPDIVMLREHFRCLPEIIAFSNIRYYDGKIEALRDNRPSPGWSPTGTVDVRIGFRKPNLDVNENEALAVVDLIADLVERPEYDGMTFGVISLLGKKQAPRIQELLLDRLGSSVMEDRRIRCGEPANFQGDERDVIVISLVVGPDASGQLGRIGAMAGPPAERRVNVAASRAANQMWIVHSIQPEDFPNQDPRAELIRHCREPARLEEISDQLLDRCESEFERRVVRDILARGFRRVRVQWVVGNYRLDIVVEGPDGRKLAVECDGDIWHEGRWDQDRARQTVLERAGWTFERIAGSAYFRDPVRALEPLWARLEELQIPTGDWAEIGNLVPPRRVVDEVPTLTAEFGIDEEDMDTNVIDELLGGAVDEADTDQVAPPLPEEESTPSVVVDLPQAAPAWRTESVEDVRLSVEDDGPRAATAPPAGDPAPRSTRGQFPMLDAYNEWLSEPLPIATEATQQQLVEALVSAVGVEGPVLARRAYLLCHQAAGGHRVGKDIRSAFNRAAYAAIRAGQLSLIRDEVPGQADKTLYLPSSLPVVVRQLGPRDLYEVPPSEVRSLIEQLNVDSLPIADVCRAVLDAYGLRKLTQKATAFIEDCLRYRWEPE